MFLTNAKIQVSKILTDFFFGAKNEPKINFFGKKVQTFLFSKRAACMSGKIFPRTPCLKWNSREQMHSKLLKNDGLIYDRFSAKCSNTITIQHGVTKGSTFRDRRLLQRRIAVRTCSNMQSRSLDL